MMTGATVQGGVPKSRLCDIPGILEIKRADNLSFRSKIRGNFQGRADPTYKQNMQAA